MIYCIYRAFVQDKGMKKDVYRIHTVAFAEARVSLVFYFQNQMACLFCDIHMH
jgi:hypothetical protein